MSILGEIGMKIEYITSKTANGEQGIKKSGPCCRRGQKGKVTVKVTQSCLTLQPHGLYSPWNSPGQNIGVGSLSFLQGIFPIQVSHVQADSLPAKPQGMPKNTGVGSLSPLQGIFPTQESNPSLLHCMRILYQLSYQGSPTEGGGSKQGKSKVKSM